MTDEPKVPEQKPQADQPAEYSPICPECHTGVYHVAYLTFHPGFVMSAVSANMMPMPSVG
jgi:hypothetical protein